MSVAITRLATESAYLAQRMATSLLASTISTAPTEDRLAAMTEAFRIWPVVCRRMAELEDAAPRSSNAGRDADDALLERLAAFVAGREVAA